MTARLERSDEQHREIISRRLLLSSIDFAQQKDVESGRCLSCQSWKPVASPIVMARPFCAYATSLLKDSDKHLEAADHLLVAAQSWLHEQVAVSREQLADCCAPPAKRQRVTKSRKAAGSGSQDKVSMMHNERIMPHLIDMLACGEPNCLICSRCDSTADGHESFEDCCFH